MSKVIFQEIVRFTFADGNGQTPDKSFRLLTLKIEETSRRSEKEFVVSVSEDDEPRFVYSQTLRRSDYELVKREQNLDADFDAFPQMVANFVLDIPRTPDSFLRGGLNADSSSFCFEMIGKMGYKWVTILTLNLHLLSDSALISHLVDRILKLKVALREVGTLKDCLAAEHKESQRLKESISEMSALHKEQLAKIETEKTEEIAQAKAETDQLKAEIEELNADKQMLNVEVGNLRDEVIDFRTRIDELMETVADLEQRIRTVTEELTATEEQLSVAERRNDELDRELCGREDELAAKEDELHDLRREIGQLEHANDVICEKLREMTDEKNALKAEHEKGLQVISKLYKEQQKKRASGDGRLALEEKIRQVEKELGDSKSAVDSLTEMNSQLKKQLEGLTSEYAKTKKSAEELEAKCERKEKMLADLLHLRRSSAHQGSTVSTPPNTIASSLPATYPRVLGVSTLLGNIQTPLRSAAYTASPTTFNREIGGSTRTFPALTTEIPPTVPNKQ